jgi:hypothetical protein
LYFSAQAVIPCHPRTQLFSGDITQMYHSLHVASLSRPHRFVRVLCHPQAPPGRHMKLEMPTCNRRHTQRLAMRLTARNIQKLIRHTYFTDSPLSFGGQLALYWQSTPIDHEEASHAYSLCRVSIESLHHVEALDQVLCINKSTPQSVKTSNIYRLHCQLTTAVLRAIYSTEQSTSEEMPEFHLQKSKNFVNKSVRLQIHRSHLLPNHFYLVPIQPPPPRASIPL